MIADLGYSTTAVAALFAIPLMISPIQIYVGYRSDRFPVLGRRREPYVVIGALLIGLGILAIADFITRSGLSGRSVAGITVAFLLYGVGRNLGHNTFQALVADRFQGAARSQAATFYKAAPMLRRLLLPAARRLRRRRAAVGTVGHQQVRRDPWRGGGAGANHSGPSETLQTDMYHSVRRHRLLPGRNPGLVRTARRVLLTRLAEEPSEHWKASTGSGRPAGAVLR